MTDPIRSPLLAAALALLLAAPAHAEESSQRAPTGLRRFALVVGSNDGGADRVRLRYAATDAIAFAKVLEELGGVPSVDTILLLDPTGEELDIGFALLENRLERAAGPYRRLEVIVYYSGHSDEQGLLLNGELVPYKGFRQRLNGLSADVRIAVLDSCASGALTRSKGGRRHAPFMIDVSQRVKGHAFLTSASATEAAQESDRVGGSFFTHYLVSGLRGAADLSGDRRVTLIEAYQFAFNETLARTENTQSGPQHPNYDIQLAGSGDLVMTDLHQTSAALVLPTAARGRFFVRDDAGRLVAELSKTAGRAVELGLEPGRYLVTVDDGATLQRGVTHLASGERVELTNLELVAVERERVALRGGPASEVQRTVELDDLDYPPPQRQLRPRSDPPAAPPPTAESAPEPEERAEPAAAIDPQAYTDVGFSLTVIPGIDTGFFVQGKQRKQFSLNLLYGRTDLLDGVEVGTVNHTLDGMSGLQFGAANLNDGFMKGVQLGNAFNLSLDGGYGAQLSLGANILSGEFAGAQIAAGVNVQNGRYQGVQLAVGANLLRGSKATLGQAAVGINFASGATRGAQLSAGANIVGGAAEPLFQATAGVNITGGPMSGAQLAAGLNYARTMQGLQFSNGANLTHRLSGAQIGILNISGDLTGAQLGILNLALGDVSGTQIGMLNISGDYVAGAPVGLLSIVKNGQLHLDLWSSDLFIFNTSVKLGSDNIYTIFHLAASPWESDERPGRTAVGFGLGGTIYASEGLFFSFDGSIYEADLNVPSLAKARMFNAPSREQIVQARLMVGYKLYEHLGAFAGLSANVYIGHDGKDQEDLGRFGGDVQQVNVVSRDNQTMDADLTTRVWPGFFAGLQI